MNAKYALVVSVLILLMVGLTSFASATTPITVKTGNFAHVDGTISASEIDGTLVTVLPMYIAGDPSKLQVSTAYLLYNPDTQMMYISVQVLSIATYLPPPTGDIWVSKDGINHKVTFDEGPLAAGSGYEVSFEITPRTEPYNVIIHINVNYQGTQTSATIGFQGKVGLSIFVLPETLLGTTIVSIFGAGAAFYGIKRYRTTKS